MIVLVADSGSTKTDWVVVKHGVPVQQIFTKGTNPYFQSEEEINKEIATNLIPNLDQEKYPIEKVWFYGAGCAYADKVEVIRAALNEHLKVLVEVGSDLLGAARGLCGQEPGIACIMGTGSNSCFYDGVGIIHSVPPLGFILGDEGSGAALGKQLVSDCLKNQLPESIKKMFLAQFKLTPEIILDRVYRRPFPNRFLAGLSSFIAQNLDIPELRSIAFNSFKLFFTRNVIQYDYEKYPAHFVGSVAYFYQPVLEEAAKEIGIHVGNVIQSPIRGLIKYHK